MCVACQHTIHRAQGHLGWDNSFKPALTIAPGESCLFECRDASNGQLTAKSLVSDVATLDFGQVNPVTGPVYVDGAKPGDALKVTIHAFEPSGFGWTANIPGFGILADQFKDPALTLWSYDTTGQTPAAFGRSGKVPLKSMIGTIGNALAAPGLHSIVPPRAVGGNMDIRDIGVGTELWLPVEVEGALFSLGDCHAAQGDGEVCGTAIETAMSVAVTIDLVKDAKLAGPRFRTSGPVCRHLDAAGYEVTTGIGPDLMSGAREAVSRMVDLLVVEHGLSPEEAYMLCSVCADLRISEIVDQPNWVVSFYFPRIVFA
jgi:acetamidase/formamidase